MHPQNTDFTGWGMDGLVLLEKGKVWEEVHEELACDKRYKDRVQRRSVLSFGLNLQIFSGHISTIKDHKFDLQHHSHINFVLVIIKQKL